MLEVCCIRVNQTYTVCVNSNQQAKWLETAGDKKIAQEKVQGAQNTDPFKTCAQVLIILAK